MSLEYLHHAIIELTPECNLKCIHCYNWWKHGNVSTVKPQNSYKKAFELIEYLIKNTTVEHLTFTGGEPTISERFLELILHAKLNGKKITIITNGNGAEKTYRQLVSMQVDMMEFSIHSSQSEIHDRITNQPGSWKKAVANMQIMLDKGIRVTPVVVLTKYNYATAEETARFFFNMGIRSIMVNRYNIGGEGLNHPNALSASSEQLNEAFLKLNNFAEDYTMRILSGVCTPHCVVNPDNYPNIRFGACADNIYQRPLTFDIEGNMRMCNHSPINVGNIYEYSFGEMVCSPYVDQWSRLDITFCQSCSRLKRCKGGCRAASEQMNRSLNCEDPIVHELGATPL